MYLVPQNEKLWCQTKKVLDGIASFWYNYV
jgi:hypothetical protein